MPVVELPFTGGEYDALAPQLAQNSAVNMYPHTLPSVGYTNQVMYPLGGLDETSLSVSSAPHIVNGFITWRNENTTESYIVILGGYAYYASAGSIFSASSIGSFPIPTSIGRCSIAANDSYVVMTESGKTTRYYDISGGGSIQAIADADFTANGDAKYVTYIDGYFIFITDEEKIIASALNDPTDYNALDFASAEYAPDGLTACFELKNQLYICGSSTIEVFSNVGGTAFPFERTGQFFDVGVLAPYSIARMGEAVYFIGGNSRVSPGVYRLEGNDLQRISNEWADRQLYLNWNANTYASSVHAWSYTKDGHNFIGFNLPGLGNQDPSTIVYDEVEGAWHERAIGSDKDQYKYSVFAYWNGRLRAWRYDDTNPLVTVTDASTQSLAWDGADCYREITLPPLSNKGQPFSVAEIELVVGGSLGTNQVFELLEAKDGETSFTSLGTRTLSTVASGGRVVWRRLGRADRFVTYRITTESSNAVPLLKVLANVTA